ncbi:MAG: TatD family hydrolase [Gammaproteobacteria bacterium]|nr:TatD family hydrolase [Gammaproteobacteria bacterium]
MFFDSHCHLDRIDLDGHNHSFPQLLETIRADQVTRMMCISVNLESFENMIALIEPYDDIYCSAGVHPGYEKVREPTVEALCALATHQKVVAIGETGLDYRESSDEMDWQRARFITHIEAARQCKLPLIIHSRNAKQDTLDLLRAHGADAIGGVLHCFTEDWDMAQQAIELGFYISISGIVTFDQARNVREMAVQVPADRLLIETDSPWLSPVPYRGKINHPGRVRFVAGKLAEIRGVSLEQLAETTYANANRLFGL